MKALIFPLLVVAVATGCSSPALRPGLFVVDSAHEARPVMLSRVNGKDDGRGIEAACIAYTSDSQLDDGVFITTRHSEGVSLHSASEQLVVQLQSTDHWLQVEEAVFTASDSTSISSSSFFRKLRLEGSVHE